jgi:hypothetical protein
VSIGNDQNGEVIGLLPIDGILARLAMANMRCAGNTFANDSP